MSGTHGPQGVSRGALLFSVLDAEGRIRIGPEEDITIIDRAYRLKRRWGHQCSFAVEWRPSLAFTSREDIPPHVWALQSAGDIAIVEIGPKLLEVYC